MEIMQKIQMLKEYIQNILLLQQPEMYVNTIISFQSVQLFIIWKRADTQAMCQHSMFLYNYPELAKLVSHYMTIFDTIVNSACSFGNSPYVDLFI